MVTSKIIGSYLGFLKDNLLSNFSVEPTFVYDESLDFRQRAVQYVTRSGIFQADEGSLPNNWSIIVWSRGSLETPPVAGRLHNNIAYYNSGSSILNGEYKGKLAQCIVSCKVVTNRIETAETIEELLFVQGSETVSFKTDYGENIGLIDCSAAPMVVTDFQSEDLEGNGTIVAISFDVTLFFPIFINPIEFQIMESVEQKSSEYNQNELDSQTT